MRFRQGEREAFERLVRQYRKPAVGFAYHLTGDYHTAEDLAQDCFAYLLVYPEKYDYRASFKTYLFTLLRNRSIDSLRKRQRVRRIEAGPYSWTDPACSRNYSTHLTLEAGGLQQQALHDPEQIAIVHEENREWQLRMQHLKPDYRTAVYLVDISGLSYTEAAAIMSRTAVSFKVLLHRARKKLRQIYEKEEWEYEVKRKRSSVSG
ncbi:RNA polymerase sigma factor [Paenibacillus ihuae]|uniref:RNA polymerase sigma factor n=1 Tax=Paenibacillus ihuae TaxID=1232431 RepID=UPI0009E79790|nr:RNA polymerase sigma factor [Paenibacillus ihuae]